MTIQTFFQSLLVEIKDEQEFIINSLFACKEPAVSPFNKNIYYTITFEELEKKFL